MHASAGTRSAGIHEHFESLTTTTVTRCRCSSILRLTDRTRSGTAYLWSLCPVNGRGAALVGRPGRSPGLSGALKRSSLRSATRRSGWLNSRMVQVVSRWWVAGWGRPSPGPQVRCGPARVVGCRGIPTCSPEKTSGCAWSSPAATGQVSITKGQPRHQLVGAMPLPSNRSAWPTNPATLAPVSPVTCGPVSSSVSALTPPRSLPSTFPSGEHPCP